MLVKLATSLLVSTMLIDTVSVSELFGNVSHQYGAHCGSKSEEWWSSISDWSPMEPQMCIMHFCHFFHLYVPLSCLQTAQ